MALSFQVIDPVSTGNTTTSTFTQAGTLMGTAPSDTGTTAAGSPYTVPAFSSQVSMTMVKKSGRYRKWETLSDQLANSKAALNAQYTNHINNVAQTANMADSQQATANASQAAVDASERTAGQTQEFIDQETISPNETNQFFEDIADAYNPGQSRGDFYDRSVADQQSSLDYYQSQSGFDAGNLDATVQGQVQIRDDILNQTVALASQDVANALTLLGAMGIDTSTMQAVTNPDGTTSYTTPEGQDLSSVISALGTSLGTKIDDAGAANLAALGYGGVGQDDLFTDIGRIQTTLGSGLDMSSVTDAVSQGFTDQQSYLSGQFGDIATGISGVGGQVTDVQTTIDTVSDAVGELDTRQLDMVTKLDNLGVDTDAIIAAVDAVQTTVDPLSGQVTDLGQSTAQAVSGLGGDVAGLFGGQDSTSQVVDAVSTRLSSDLGVGDSSLSSIASSIATVGEAQTDDQKALVDQIGRIQTGVTNMDSAIKTNIDDEFKNLMTVFDSNGQLITDFTNAAGEEVKAQLNDDGTLVVSTLTQLGTDVGNIDLSSLDTMKTSIDAAAGSFDTAESALGSFTSFETKSANDRKTVLDAIKADSTALDTLINTGIPQTISTGLGDYKLEVGANDELLITNLAKAVGFNQSDVASATATAVGFNQANVASAAASAVGFNQSNLVSALDTAVAYDSAALVSAIGFDPTKLSTANTAVANIQTVVDNIKSGALNSNDLATLGELDASVITNLVDKVDQKVAGSINKEDLISRIQTGQLSTADLDNLELLDSQDITDAVDLSGLSTLGAADVTSAVGYNPTNLLAKISLLQPEVLDTDDLAALSTLTVDDLPTAGSIADAVDYDPVDLLAKIASGRPETLTTDDLTALSTLTVADLPIAPTAAEVATAVNYNPTELTSDFTTAIANSEKALSDLQAGQTTTIKGAIGTYQAAVTDDGTLLVSAFDNLDGSIIALDTEVANIDVSSLDTILSGVQAIPTTALSAQQVTEAVGYNAQDLLDSIAKDALTDADLANLSTLTLDDIPKAGEIAGLVDYDPDALMTRIKAGKADDLTEDDLTALSTLTVADLPVAPTAASVASAVKVDLDSLQTNLASGALTVEDLSALSRLTVDDLPTTAEISGAVNYDPTDLLDKISLLQPEVLTQDDLDVLSTLTTEDLSGLATQETASQAAASAASAVVSLGPISGISTNIDSLLSAADADATANGLRDSAIADSRQDVLTALSQDEGAMRTLFDQQTVDIRGELGDYNVRIDSETGSIVASQLSTQTSNLSGLIDTATGTLLTDSASGLTALEQDILDSKNDLYTTLNTAFTAEGDLITNAIDANGDDITRVLDDQGTLTETVTDMNGIVQNEVVTNLGSILDETGRISTTALEIAADTNAESIFSTVQDVFDDQGLLKSEEYDRFNNLIIREFDENNDILERYYNADGTLSGEKILRLEEILSSLFPDAPLAEAAELTGADQRFLQGFRTQGLMSGV